MRRSASMSLNSKIIKPRLPITYFQITDFFNRGVKEHGSIVAVLCANFRNDFATEMVVLDERSVFKMVSMA